MAGCVMNCSIRSRQVTETVVLCIAESGEQEVDLNNFSLYLIKLFAQLTLAKLMCCEQLKYFKYFSKNFNKY